MGVRDRICAMTLTIHLPPDDEGVVNIPFIPRLK